MKLRKPSILVTNWVSSCLSFFLGTFTAATCICTAPNYTTTIISLEPCALNAGYQHFILRFIKMSLLSDTTERGYRGWKEAQRQGEDRVTLPITLISWRTLVSFSGFFEDYIFCMVKYLSFHNSSSFALKIKF